MEKLLRSLPTTLYDEQFECTSWLTLTATSTGTWQAGYQNTDGEMHLNLFVESDSPTGALQRLKLKTEIIAREKVQQNA